MTKPIVIYGDNRLRQISKEIEKNSDVKDLVKDLWDTLNFHDTGVGLAAPQIGINLRVFIVDDKMGLHKTFINPTITTSGNEVLVGEGCLSIPELSGTISRPQTVEITYYDENWAYHSETYSGFASRIIQHEYDHLEGMMWVDRIPLVNQISTLQKLIQIRNGAIV
jgi:peptide deformylase